MEKRAEPPIGPLLKKKPCKFCMDDAPRIDYKEVDTLRHFITERATIIPRRITGVCAKHQRKLRKMIIRARFLALLPYTNLHR